MLVKLRFLFSIPSSNNFNVVTRSVLSRDASCLHNSGNHLGALTWSGVLEEEGNGGNKGHRFIHCWKMDSYVSFSK